MPLILTCYVSVSNCLKYYLRKPFSLSPVISLGRPRHLVIICYVLCIWKKKKLNLALKNLFCFISFTSELNMRGGLTGNLKLERSFGWSRNPALVCCAERRWNSLPRRRSLCWKVTRDEAQRTSAWEAGIGRDNAHKFCLNSPSFLSVFKPFYLFVSSP